MTEPTSHQRNIRVRHGTYSKLDAFEETGKFLLEVGLAEEVSISIVTHDMGHAAAKQAAAARRRAARRQQVIERARRAISAKARELGLPHNVVAAAAALEGGPVNWLTDERALHYAKQVVGTEPHYTLPEPAAQFVTKPVDRYSMLSSVAVSSEHE